MWEANRLRRKNKVTMTLKTGRFDDIDSAVIISSVSTAVQSFVVERLCTAVLTLLVMTAESMASKRQVLRISMTSFSFLKL